MQRRRDNDEIRQRLQVPMPTPDDWAKLMSQHGTPWEHEALLNTWLGSIQHYQSCVQNYEASKHAFFLGKHTSEMIKMTLESGGRLQKQFAILLFHLCSKHTQAQLPPHALQFFVQIGPLIDSWLLGLQENGKPFSTSVTDASEYVLGVKFDAFATHIIDRVYMHSYHGACVAQSAGDHDALRH